MSSDDTFAAGLDLSAAWIGRNFSVKLKIKILAKNIEMVVFGLAALEAKEDYKRSLCGCLCHRHYHHQGRVETDIIFITHIVMINILTQSYYD